MTTLADKAILSGADNRPPMLEKDMYDSWKSRMELYMLNRQNGRMILPIVDKWSYKAKRNILSYLAIEALQVGLCYQGKLISFSKGLPPEVFALVSNHKSPRNFRKLIQLLMQGTSLTKQERECKLYDEFVKFAYKKGGSLYEFYLRFSLLLNDMNIYNMKLEQFQVNTKFLNTLHPEWSKFMTDVKLVQDLHTTNIDQLHVYLGQHEFHANVVHLIHERNSDPLSLSPQYGSPYQSQQYSTHQSSRNNLFQSLIINEYQSLITTIIYSPSSLYLNVEYHPSVDQQFGIFQQNQFNCSMFQKGDKLLSAGPFKDLYSGSKCETILEIKDGYFATTATGRPHVPTVQQNHRGNRMIRDPDSSKVAVQNSNSSTQQDDLILSVIEQLKTQVVHCTKMNLENKSVNDTLTAELERYKEQVKVLKDGQNVDLKSQDNVLDSCAQSVEIDHLKRTLSEHLKEKESLLQTVTLLKNDFKKEESRNLDREIALEK
ncbi:hypothetical protein Tco_0586650 [Tanacetum coccineum]